jgi:hypothetical protein
MHGEFAGPADHQAGADSEQQQDPRNHHRTPRRCNFASAPFFSIRSRQRFGARLARWERALRFRIVQGGDGSHAAPLIHTEFPRKVAEVALAHTVGGEWPTDIRSA